MPATKARGAVIDSFHHHTRRLLTRAHLQATCQPLFAPGLDYLGRGAAPQDHKVDLSAASRSSTPDFTAEQSALLPLRHPRDALLSPVWLRERRLEGLLRVIWFLRRSYTIFESLQRNKRPAVPIWMSSLRLTRPPLLEMLGLSSLSISHLRISAQFRLSVANGTKFSYPFFGAIRPRTLEPTTMRSMVSSHYATCIFGSSVNGTPVFKWP